MIVPALLASAAVVGMVGRVYRRAVMRQVDARFERDEAGIIRGAGPITHSGANGAAVLLVHGGGDTPQTMHHVADAFHALGYTVVAPLLPGHGRDLAAFDEQTADTWYAAVRGEFEALRSAHDWVGVIGLSMGGALSARLAAETQRVDALVLASPYVSMPTMGAILARTAAFWGVLFPVVRTASDRSVLDPEARAVSLGYGAFTHRTLRALRETAWNGFRALPEITAPTLVIQSTTDNRITSAATERAFETIGATDKRLEWIEGAGHVITVDFGWQRVVDQMVQWMETHRTAKRTGRRRGAPALRR